MEEWATSQSFQQPGKLYLTRVRGLTRSTSARRQEDDWFAARSKPCHSLKMLKFYLQLLCQIRNINNMSRGEHLGSKQAQLIRQGSYNHRVGCLLCRMAVISVQGAWVLSLVEVIKLKYRNTPHSCMQMNIILNSSPKKYVHQMHSITIR